MQVVINKCFLLNSEKNLAQIRLVVFEKNAKNAHFNSEKLRHRANHGFRKPETKNFYQSLFIFKLQMRVKIILI